MPRAAFVCTLLVALAGFALSGTTQKPPRELPPPTDIDPGLTQQLRQLEQEFAEAILHEDAQVLDRLVGPEYTLRISDYPEQSLPRAIWMDNTLNKAKAESLEHHHDAARKLADDLAVVSLLLTQKASMNGRDFGGTSYLVDLWKKRAGTWQIIARNGTRVNRARRTPPLQLPPPTDADPQLTEQLRQLELQLGKAAMHMDIRVLESVVGPEYTLRVGDAPEQSVPRDLWMESVQPQSAHSYKLECFDEHYHAARKLTDNLAVVSLLLTQKATFAGRDRSGDFYVVDIWKKNGENWQIIARYSTPIAKESDRSPPQ